MEENNIEPQHIFLFLKYHLVLAHQREIEEHGESLPLPPVDKTWQSTMFGQPDQENNSTPSTPESTAASTESLVDSFSREVKEILTQLNTKLEMALREKDQKLSGVLDQLTEDQKELDRIAHEEQEHVMMERKVELERRRAEVDRIRLEVTPDMETRWRLCFHDYDHVLVPFKNSSEGSKAKSIHSEDHAAVKGKAYGSELKVEGGMEGSSSTDKRQETHSEGAHFFLWCKKCGHCPLDGRDGMPRLYHNPYGC